ncbi:hypothetical protein GCM10007242_14610 [Pigmentiphaga litoralis]|nr:hypothetical protein GCM10007242_14610 [Pigmentiphaga litoralis]
MITEAPVILLSAAPSKPPPPSRAQRIWLRQSASAAPLGGWREAPRGGESSGEIFPELLSLFKE